MPYHVVKKDDKWCVEKEDDGEAMGCHDSEEEANGQMRAIYANEKKEADEEPAPASFHEAELDTDSVTVGDPKPMANPEPKDKSFFDKVADTFRKPEDITLVIGSQDSGFKAVKGEDGKARWIGWYSNAFKDRDGEYFPARAIDAYVARVDMGLVPYPALWLDHVPGAKVGQADWVGRIGLFSVAVGTFDDSEIGRKAQAYFTTTRKAHSMSHGFEYDARRKVDNAFWQFNTFEVSVLPMGKEANPFTSFGGVKEMSIAEWKQEDLTEKLGADLAKRVLEQTDAHSKALAEKNVAWKDFTDTAPAVEAVASQKAVDAAASDLKAFIPDFLEVQTDLLNDQTVMVKTIKAQDARIAELETQVKEALAEVAAIKGDRPRSASQDTVTILSEDKLPAQVKNALSSADDVARSVFGNLVSE